MQNWANMVNTLISKVKIKWFNFLIVIIVLSINEFNSAGNENNIYEPWQIMIAVIQ